MSLIYNVLKQNGGGMKATELIVKLAPIMVPGTMNIYTMAREDERVGELEYSDPNYTNPGRIKSFFYIKP